MSTLELRNYGCTKHSLHVRSDSHQQQRMVEVLRHTWVTLKRMGVTVQLRGLLLTLMAGTSSAIAHNAGHRPSRCDRRRTPYVGNAGTWRDTELCAGCC
jgi:hypothetical protein